MRLAYLANPNHPLTFFTVGLSCILAPFACLFVAALPTMIITNQNKQVAQPIESEILTAYEQYLTTAHEGAVVTEFDAIAYDGTIACADVTYETPQISYVSRPTPETTPPPTRIWYRQEYLVVVFKKQNSHWTVEEEHWTGCSICNGSGWGPDPYDRCPASVNKP